MGCFAQLSPSSFKCLREFFCLARKKEEAQLPRARVAQKKQPHVSFYAPPRVNGRASFGPTQLTAAQHAGIAFSHVCLRYGARAATQLRIARSQKLPQGCAGARFAKASPERPPRFPHTSLHSMPAKRFSARVGGDACVSIQEIFALFAPRMRSIAFPVFLQGLAQPLLRRPLSGAVLASGGMAQR